MKIILIYLMLLLTSDIEAKQLFPMPANIGPDWQGGTGVVIEDLEKPPAFFLQSMAKSIEQFKSIDVKSMANLSYRKQTNLMHQVELKLFEFKTTDAAKAWEKKKYGYNEWQQHYTRSKEGDLVIFDSKQINKRIIFLKNYWVTASVLNEGDDHLLFLDHVIEKIQSDNED